MNIYKVNHYYKNTPTPTITNIEAESFSDAADEALDRFVDVSCISFLRKKEATNTELEKEIDKLKIELKIYKDITKDLQKQMECVSTTQEI